MEVIKSGQNPKIKELLALQEKSKLRRERGLFVVEGRRELEHCIAAGYTVRSLFVCPDVYGDFSTSLEMTKEDSLSFRPSEASGEIPGNAVFYVSREVYDKIAYRGGTEGIIAEVVTPERTLKDLNLPENPLVMVLEAVEKPGNLGAVLRSADAAKADAVIICDPLTDLFNPNLIRASIGAVFTVPVVTATSEETISFLKDKRIQILTAQLQDSSLYYDCDMKRGTALVMGTESSGLSDKWRQAADAHIRIPMLGRLDSLNVSVSAAILLFEAVRQRNK